MNPSWQQEFNRFESQILPKLKNMGLEIGEAARSGNDAASEVIKLYSMLKRSFDPITLIRLEESLNKYQNA
jgi:hypothetical protein